MQGSVLASYLLPEAVLGHSGRGSKNPSKDPKWTVHRVAREHRHGPPPPGPESKPMGKVSRAAGDPVNPSNHLTRGPGFREHLPPSSLGLQGAPQTRPPGQRDTQDPGGQHTRAQSATLLKPEDHCQLLIGVESSRREDYITNRQIHRNYVNVGILESMMDYGGCRQDVRTRTVNIDGINCQLTI